MIAPTEWALRIHAALEWAGVLTGLLLLGRQRKRAGAPGVLESPGFIPLLGGLLGAALGNKLAAWFDVGMPWSSGWSPLLAGQSVVGALLGGWLGVEAGKRCVGITARTGDAYVLPFLVGLAIGRVGCFLSGLNDGTCGLPTSLPWGVDFGDGIPRHPVQLYEIGLAGLAAATGPWWRQPFARQPGLAFRVMAAGYLLWRVLVDFLKPVPHAYKFGLSGIQWISILGLLIMGGSAMLHRSPSQHESVS